MGGRIIVKLILCMAVVAASLGIGLYLSSRLSERIKVLGKYITLLEEASVKMT